MATRITQAPNGRKTVACDLTGLGFTRIGNALDPYTATDVSWRMSDRHYRPGCNHEHDRRNGYAGCPICW